MVLKKREKIKWIREEQEMSNDCRENWTRDQWTAWRRMKRKELDSIIKRGSRIRGWGDNKSKKERKLRARAEEIYKKLVESKVMEEKA